MFEKEAEEYSRNFDWTNDDRIIDYSERGFRNGAEFGYNFAKEEIDYLNKHWGSEEERKANEWHFVSKEGFPNKDDIYLIIRRDGLHLGDYCCGGDGDIDCQSWCDYPSEEEIQDDSVIAWKEIVLPKEIKEND